MLPWSVMPTAGCPSPTAASITSSTLGPRRRASRTRCAGGGGRTSPPRRFPFYPAPARSGRLRPDLHACDLHRSRTARGTYRAARGLAAAPAPAQAAAGRGSARAAGGRPSAARRASPGCRGRGPRASRRAGPWRPGARPRSACRCANGGASRASSSRRSGESAAAELVHRRLVDVPQPLAARLVERGRAHLVEQLLDHRADPHHLRGLLDRLRVDLRGVRLDLATPGVDHLGGTDRLVAHARHTTGPTSAPSRQRRHERHEHLGRGQRAVPGDERERPAVGRIVERDVAACREQHVAEPVGRRRGHPRAEPSLVEDLVPAGDPRVVAVARRPRRRAGRRPDRRARGASERAPRRTGCATHGRARPDRAADTFVADVDLAVVGRDAAAQHRAAAPRGDRRPAGRPTRARPRSAHPSPYSCATLSMPS